MRYLEMVGTVHFSMRMQRMPKKICGLKLPEEINTYIRETAEKDGRSLANVVARMVIDSYNRDSKEDK